MIRIENLTKVYEDGVKALDDVSLEFKDGEFVVIIGLSGSGKSTLLRCINRLIEPTSGKIFIDDVEITALSIEEMRKYRRNIGMIFQHFNLVKRSNVLTNVLTGRLGYTNPSWSFFNRYKKEDYEEAMNKLEMVGISEKAYNRADALSGGQQQRVGIARALMQNPKILLADEPVASLDPATSHSVLKYVKQYNTEAGKTVLCSLHFLSLARDYGTRIIAMKDGKVVFDGLPSEIDNERFKSIYGQDAVRVEIA
jgi:phosphonate transport system ATP-binding protein